MEKIVVQEKRAVAGGREFVILVGGGSVVSEYTVTLADSYWEKLTAKRISREELIRKSFEFLLERETTDEILSEFGLPVIQQYFSEYEETMRSSV